MNRTMYLDGMLSMQHVVLQNGKCSLMVTGDYDLECVTLKKE